MRWSEATLKLAQRLPMEYGIRAGPETLLLFLTPVLSSQGRKNYATQKKT